VVGPVPVIEPPVVEPPVVGPVPVVEPVETPIVTAPPMVTTA
jgi:hypothetical protein